MFHWFGVITNTKGDSLPGWQVECVQLSDGSTVVPIYSDENLTPILTTSGISDRALADASGNYDFFIAEGTYSLRFYDANGVFQRMQRYLPMYGNAPEAAIDAMEDAQAARDEAVAASELAQVTAGGTVYATWADLAAATGMAAGDSAVVFEDAGTHTDPVNGGTVDNAGIYIYSASPAGWERVADTEAVKAADSASAAAAAQTAAETARDEAIAAPLEPTITALGQGVDAGAQTVGQAVEYVENSLLLDIVNGQYRSGTSKASSLAALNVLTLTQAATTYAPGTGTFASFAANTPRVTNRGLLIASAATNSFTYSNDFSNAIWLKLNLNTTAGQTDPLGGTTATKLTPTTTSGVHRLRNEILGATTNGRVVNLSYRFKADGYSQVRIYAVANSGFVGTFDLSAGTVTSTGGVNGGTAPTTATITDIGGGFYELTIGGTFNSSNTGQTLAVSILVLSGGNETFAGDGTSGVVLWEASGPEGNKGVIPTTSAAVTRSADAAPLDLLAGAADDTVIVTYEGGESTILRSALVSSTSLDLASDASAPWLDKFITRIELLPAAVSSGNALAAIRNAVRNYALFPRPTAALAANDTPTLTLGTAGAASLINGAATNAPNLPRTDSKITYVSGVPMQFGTSFPRTIFYISRGAFYGWGDAGGTVPVRGTGYFAYEIVHTGTEFDVPVLGSGSGGTNFRLLVNGCEAGTVAVPNSTGSIYYLRVVFPASGTRTIRVETSGVPCNGFNAASTSEFSSVARSYPLVTMIGDSFVEGSGAGMGDMESVVLLRGLGFNAAPAGVGSTGLINPGGNNTSGFPKVAWWHPERLKDLTLSGVTSVQTGLAVSPAMGVVCGSLNDSSLSSGVWSPYGATLTAAIENRAHVLIDAWVAANAGKPLVFFGPIWPSGLPDNRPPIQIYQIRDGYQRAAASRFSDNVWFLDRMAYPRREGLYSNTGDQASLYTGGTTGTDPTHPTPAGHRFDGLTDAAELRRLILSELA